MMLKDNIATDISGKNPYIQCSTCGKKIFLSIDNISIQLSSGWKKCCGYTMTYYSDK